MSITDRVYTRSPWREEVDVEPPFSDFGEWFSSILEDTRPELIVGIARSALRLLQVQRAQELAPAAPIVSNHALPFLRPEQLKSKSILVFDDSVVFGSTIAKIRSHLIDKGAHVSCATYVVDRTNFYGEEESQGSYDAVPSEHSDIPLRVKHRLWPGAIRQHHETLIHRILQTPRSYNLEFPLLSIDVADYKPADIPFLCHLLSGKGLMRVLADVSPPSASVDGVYRYTALLTEHRPRFLNSDQVVYRPYSKARVTFVPKKGEIRLRPLPQLSTCRGLTFETIQIADDHLHSLWNRLQPPIEDREDLYCASLLRLLTAYVAMFLGETLCEEAVRSLADELPIKQVRLMTDDVGMLLGPENAQTLLDLWLDITSKQASSFFDLSGAAPNHVPGDSPDPALFKAIAQVWKDQPHLRPSENESLYEAVGKVFLTMRAATDTPKHRHDNPDATRLDVGMSYDGVRQLLAEECARSLTPDDVSLAMDLCVDNGQAVPRVLLNQSRWLRAFYSGEGEDSQAKQQFKLAMYIAYREFLTKRTNEPLTHFDFQKICVTLKDLMPWLPLSTRYYNFGRTAVVGNAEDELIPWITDKSTGPLLDELRDGRKTLKVNSSFRSCVNSTWAADRNQTFHDSFHHLASVFSKLQDRAKLLLSSCRTHRHTYNAVAFEAHSWVQHRAGNFEKLIAEARNLAEGSIDAGPLAMNSLYWCIRFVSEARKKHEIFHLQFASLRKELHKAFAKQGVTAKHLWEFGIEGRNLLDPTPEKEVEYLFHNLMPILDQITCLTQFLGHFLLQSTGLSFGDLERIFDAEGTTLRAPEFSWFRDSGAVQAASQYNNSLHGGTIPGASLVKTTLHEKTPGTAEGKSSRQFLSETLDHVDRAFSELRVVLGLFCPKYDVAEGDFPYSPASDRRTLSDGSLERIVSDVFVLTLDLIHSTDSQPTNRLKDAIVDTFRKLERPEFYYEVTGNDAYVAVSPDPAVLWDAAQIIKMHGDITRQPGDPLDGTRKGISFGTLRIVKDPNGAVRIMDASYPNLLPKAFYMLKGVDEHCSDNKGKRNSVLVFEGHALDMFRQALGKPLKELGQVFVDSKHFYGNCCVVDIS